MKSSKLTDYVKMSESDLQNEIKELKKELFKARFQHAMNGLDNPKKLTQIRRNIARANTMQHTISINASK